MFWMFEILTICYTDMDHISGVVNMVGVGSMFAHPSALRPALLNSSSPIHTDLPTATYIVSCVGVAGLPGFFASSIIMVSKGRRLAHILATAPAVVGYVIMYLANDVSAVMIGRALSGYTAGASLGLGVLMIGEYSGPIHRGMFLNLKTAAICAGSLEAHILGNYYDWRTVALVTLFFHLSAMTISWLSPETPHWLASKARFSECRDSFILLRGIDEASAKELEDLIEQQKKRTLLNQRSQRGFVFEFLKKFKRRDFLLPSCIVCLGPLMLEVCGKHIFPAFALDIIGEITGNKIQTFYYTLGFDAITTLSALFSSVLVKIMRRRTLLFSTGSSSLSVLFFMCLYVLLVSRQVIPKDYPVIPMSLLVIYFSFLNSGVIPMCLGFLGEIVPLAHKGAASILAGIVTPLSLYVALQVTPFLLRSFMVHGTFAVLGGCLALILLILYFILPETKDRTLQDIEGDFCGVKKDDASAKMIEKGTS